MASPIARGCGWRPVYGWSRALPGTATLNPRFKLMMLIAARRTERRERRFAVRDVGSGRSGVTGSIGAA